MAIKTIGIDARLIHLKGVGVGTYTINLLQNLIHIHPQKVKFIIYIFERSAQFDVPNGVHVEFKIAPYRWHSFSEQLSFLMMLVQDNLDCMHFTYFSFPILYFRPFVITLHDLTPLFFKTGEASSHSKVIYAFKHIAYRLAMFMGVTRSKAIIVPTHSVGNDICATYGTAYKQKIHVTYEGLDSALQHVAIPEKVPGYPSHFYIKVGNFYPHKNTQLLIKAFSRIKTGATLFCVGPKDYFSTEIARCIKYSNEESHIKLLFDIDARELAYLYTHAQALIMPSLTEGFGLPLLEAVHFSCPIIASDIPVFHELIQDSYYSFDPTNNLSLQNAIETFEKDKTKKRVSKDVLKKFSFKQMARETMEVYEKIVFSG